MIHNINMIKNPNFKYTQKKNFFIANTNFRMAFYEKNYQNDKIHLIFIRNFIYECEKKKKVLHKQWQSHGGGRVERRAFAPELCKNSI